MISWFKIWTFPFALRYANEILVETMLWEITENKIKMEIYFFQNVNAELSSFFKVEWLYLLTYLLTNKSQYLILYKFNINYNNIVKALAKAYTRRTFVHSALFKCEIESKTFKCFLNLFKKKIMTRCQDHL